MYFQKERTQMGHTSRGYVTTVETTNLAKPALAIIPSHCEIPFRPSAAMLSFFKCSYKTHWIVPSVTPRWGPYRNLESMIFLMQFQLPPNTFLSPWTNWRKRFPTQVRFRVVAFPWRFLAADKCTQLYSRPSLYLSAVSRLQLLYVKKLSWNHTNPRPLNKASDDYSRRMSLKKGKGKLRHGKPSEILCVVKHYRIMLPVSTKLNRKRNHCAWFTHNLNAQCSMFVTNTGKSDRSQVLTTSNRLVTIAPHIPEPLWTSLYLSWTGQIFLKTFWSSSWLSYFRQFRRDMTMF
jgi:hypothetical protein